MPLRHVVGDGGGVAAGRGALRPDLLEPLRYRLNPFAYQAGIAVAEIFGADVDDPAGVDHIVGRIEDSAFVEESAVDRLGELVVGRPGDYRSAQSGDAFLVEDRAKRVGADDVGLEEQDLGRVDDFAAGHFRELFRLRPIDVGDRQFRALAGGVHRNARRDAAGALDGDVQPFDAVLAERALDRRLDPQERTQRGVRSRVASNTTFVRKTGDIFGLAADLDHVGDAHADVLGGDVAAAQTVDRLAERGEQLRRLAALRRRQDHCLAAAERKPGHRILVAHAPRQPERVGQRQVGILIMPETRPARRRPEVGRMDGDDRAQAVLGLVDEMEDLMRVEVGIVPRRFHGCGSVPLKKNDGATEGT